MKQLRVSIMLAGLFLAVGPGLFSATPLGGLAVALSPAGDVMVAGGDNRTLLVVDPVKMEVSRRIWLGVSIVDLEFNRDGTSLLVNDTDGTLHLVESKTWVITKQEKNAGQMSAARDVDLVAGLDPDRAGNVVKILSMSNLGPKCDVTLVKGQRVMAFGLDPKGTRLAVMLAAASDESEPKETKVPAGLKGLAADEFRLKNDGRTSQLMVFEIPGGKKISDMKLYYSPSTSNWKILFQGDNVLLVNYNNINAAVSPDGGVTLFELDNSFNYGIGWSADQKILLSGGLSIGTYTRVESMTQARFDADKLPTWPEYFKSFAVAADGTAYGATTARRVIRIKPDGKFDKGFPLY